MNIFNGIEFICTIASQLKIQALNYQAILLGTTYWTKDHYPNFLMYVRWKGVYENEDFLIPSSIQ